MVLVAGGCHSPPPPAQRSLPAVAPSTEVPLPPPLPKPLTGAQRALRELEQRHQAKARIDLRADLVVVAAPRTDDVPRYTLSIRANADVQREVARYESNPTPKLSSDETRALVYHAPTKSLRVYEAQTGVLLHRAELANEERPLTMTMSEDGELIGAIVNDETCVARPRAAKSVVIRDAVTSAEDLIIHPRGLELVLRGRSGTTPVAWVYDGQTLAKKRELDAAYGSPIVYSADGSMMAYGSGSSPKDLLIVSPATGKLLKKVTPLPGSLVGAWLNRQGSVVVTYTEDDKTDRAEPHRLCAWELTREQRAKKKWCSKQPQLQPPLRVTFDQAGDIDVVSALEADHTHITLATGKVEDRGVVDRQALPGSTKTAVYPVVVDPPSPLKLTSIAVALDGSFIAYQTEERSRLIDTKTFDPPRVDLPVGLPRSSDGGVSFAEDSSLVHFQTPSRAYLFEARSAKRITQFDDVSGGDAVPPPLMQLMPDGQSVLLRERRTDHYAIVNPKTGAIVSALGAITLPTGLPVTEVVPSGDGKKLFVGSKRSSEALLIDARTNARTPIQLPVELERAAPLGAGLLLQQRDGVLLVCAKSDAPIPSGCAPATDADAQGAGGDALAFHAISRPLAGMRIVRSQRRNFTNDVIQIWDATPGGPRAKAPIATVEHGSWPHLFATTNGGHGFLSASYDGTLRVWSFASGGLEPALQIELRNDTMVVLANKTGHAELFGKAARDRVVCRVGAQTLPLEACEEDLILPGLLRRALAGR